MKRLASIRLKSARNIFAGPDLDDIDETDDEETVAGDGFLPPGLKDGPGRKPPSRENSLGGTNAFAQMFAQYDKIVDSVSSFMTNSTEEAFLSDSDDEGDDEDDDDGTGVEDNKSKDQAFSINDSQEIPRNSTGKGPDRGIPRKSSRESPIMRGLARRASRDGPLMRQVARSLSGEKEQEQPARLTRRPGLNSRPASCLAIGTKGEMTEMARPTGRMQRMASTNHVLLERQGSFKMNDFFKAYEDEITLTTGW